MSNWLTLVILSNWDLLHRRFSVFRSSKSNCQGPDLLQNSQQTIVCVLAHTDLTPEVLERGYFGQQQQQQQQQQ